MFGEYIWPVKMISIDWLDSWFYFIQRARNQVNQLKSFSLVKNIHQTWIKVLFWKFGNSTGTFIRQVRVTSASFRLIRRKFFLSSSFPLGPSDLVGNFSFVISIGSRQMVDNWTISSVERKLLDEFFQLATSCCRCRVKDKCDRLYWKNFSL